MIDFSGTQQSEDGHGYGYGTGTQGGFAEGVYSCMEHRAFSNNKGVLMCWIEGGVNLRCVPACSKQPLVVRHTHCFVGAYMQQANPDLHQYFKSWRVVVRHVHCFIDYCMQQANPCVLLCRLLYAAHALATQNKG